MGSSHSARWKKVLRPRTLLILIPIGLAILLQVYLDSGVPMRGAAFVDPSQDQIHLDSTNGRLDWGAVTTWSPSKKVAGFRNSHRIYITQPVRRGQSVFPLPAGEHPLSGVRYRLWNFTRHPVLVPLFRTYDIEDFIRHNNVVGLLVIKSGRVVLETYAAGNSPQTRWTSWSVAKSVLSMLLGAAVADGAISSTGDRVTDYLPELAGTPYERVTLENLLQMSSGMEWNLGEEAPDWKEVKDLPFASIVEYMGNKVSQADPGTVFNYNDSGANLLGAVVSEAIGEDLNTYLERKIWQPFGMESDADWLSYPGGLQSGACCISATLRDYGRLGLFAMRNGQLADGTSVLPGDWMERSVTPSAAASNYGYLWWLNADGSYAAMGIYGQLIHVNPAEELVIAAQGAWDSPFGDDYYIHQAAFIEAVTAALK